MQLVDDDLAARLRRYVDGGGRLLLGPRAGARTATGRAQPAAPGPLRELIGARVTRVDALRPGVTRTLHRSEDGHELRYRTWADLLEPEGGETLAVYDDPAYRGAAAYVRRASGAGEARMLGASLEPEAMVEALAPWLEELGLDPRPLPEGVRRAGDWLLNFMDHEVHVAGATVPAHGAVRAATEGRGGERG
jgi:beta-galactosidase